VDRSRRGGSAVRGAVERVEGPVVEGRWVAVVRLDGALWAVGPLPEHNAMLALAGLVEGWPGAERVGVAELIGPGEAHDRLSQVRREGRSAGVSRPLPRHGEETS